MKIKLLMLLAISAVLNSCGQKKNEQSFEGIITYKVSFISKSDNVKYNDYQKQKFGEKLKTYILKNGSFKQEYLLSGDKGYDFVIYNSLSNKSYAKWRNIDTTYTSNCATNSLILNVEKDLPVEKVYGQLCEGYLISSVEPNSGQKVSVTYFYPKNKEYLNPTFYKNFKDGFYDKVSKKMKSPFYKMIMDMENYIVTFEVEKIEKTIVNPKLLEMPNGIPLKEI